jgi:hypothetical protein
MLIARFICPYRDEFKLLLGDFGGRLDRIYRPNFVAPSPFTLSAQLSDCAFDKISIRPLVRTKMKFRFRQRAAHTDGANRRLPARR